jgi:hypothetical protein
VMSGKFGSVAGLLQSVCEGEKRGNTGLFHSIEESGTAGFSRFCC